MKLEFEVIDVGECRITLDGKSVIAKRVPFGAEVDCNSLPQDTVGRVVVEGMWTIAERLWKCSAIAEGMPWMVRNAEVLEEAYEVAEGD